MAGSHFISFFSATHCFLWGSESKNLDFKCLVNLYEQVRFMNKFMWVCYSFHGSVTNQMAKMQFMPIHNLHSKIKNRMQIFEWFRNLQQAECTKIKIKEDISDHELKSPACPMEYSCLFSLVSNQLNIDRLAILKPAIVTLSVFYGFKRSRSDRKGARPCQPSILKSALWPPVL